MKTTASMHVRASIGGSKDKALVHVADGAAFTPAKVPGRQLGVHPVAAAAAAAAMQQLVMLKIDGAEARITSGRNAITFHPGRLCLLCHFLDWRHSSRQIQLQAQQSLNHQRPHMIQPKKELASILADSHALTTI